VWGSEEAKEGMNAFLAGRQPDFQKFRVRAKRELDGYLRRLAKKLNEPPALREKVKS
jgi:naphthoate synthase